MPAKLVPYVVMMPEGWKPEKCDFCCQFGAEYCKGCELSNAKKAVEVNNSLTRAIEAGIGKAATLYAVEDKK